MTLVCKADEFGQTLGVPTIALPAPPGRCLQLTRDNEPAEPRATGRPVNRKGKVYRDRTLGLTTISATPVKLAGSCGDRQRPTPSLRGVGSGGAVTALGLRGR